MPLSNVSGTSGRLALVLLGDVMLGRTVSQSLVALPGQDVRVWSDTLPLLQGGMAGPGEEQLNACNLETTLTTSDKAVPKTFNFKAQPGVGISALRHARIAMVSLANNHSLDYSQEGLAETMDALRQAGIAFAGVGTAAEARRPTQLVAAGLRLSFLCFSDHYEEWAATEKTPGINFINPESFDSEAVRALVAPAAAACDLLIIQVHWGPNWQWVPSKQDDIQRLARLFVDWGAGIVFGHSSHHIQPIEVYRGRPIVYGAGGFIDDYRVDQHFSNNLGAMYCCHISDTGIPLALDVLPTQITHTWLEGTVPYKSEVGLARGAAQEFVRCKLEQLSSQFKTAIQRTDRGLRVPLGST